MFWSRLRADNAALRKRIETLQAQVDMLKIHREAQLAPGKQLHLAQGDIVVLVKDDLIVAKVQAVSACELRCVV